MMRFKKINKQSGATAIEFAFVFPVLFMLVYATCVYGYVFFVYQGIQYAVQQGAEAAMSADPTSTSYKTVATNLATVTITQDLDWLPSNQVKRVASTVNFLTLPSDNQSSVQVQVVYNLDGLFPSIKMPFVSTPIPPLPATLVARALSRPGVGS